MAKIVLVSPKANATTWQLARALKAQQHEVVLLTSYGECVEETHGIEFMAYFKRWSIVEGLKIIPGLFGMQAQILHLLLEEDQLNPAQLVLAAYAKSHPQCVLTTSLFHIRKGLGRRNPVRYLVEESDIVTCPTVEAMGDLRGLNVRTKRQGRGILPPVLNLEEQNIYFDSAIDEAEKKISANLQGEKFALLPFHEKTFSPESEFFLNLHVLAQKQTVILWGSYSHWNLRTRKQFHQWMEKHGLADKWMVTGEISAALVQQLLENCEALVLAGLPLTPIELTDYFMKAIHGNCTLVLDSTQANVHGTLWKNGQNCWILSAGRVTNDLVKLSAKSSLRTTESLSEKIVQERHWLDHPMNELNRLYSRALEQKS